MRKDDEQADINGERIDSDSSRERSERGPGREEDEESGVSERWEEDRAGEAEEGGVDRRSIRDLHCCASLEWPLRHDAPFMIFSSAGITIWFRRVSASEE